MFECVDVLPYIFAVTFFVVAWVLLSTTGQTFFSQHTATPSSAVFIMAMLFAALGFIAVTYTIKRERRRPVKIPV